MFLEKLSLDSRATKRVKLIAKKIGDGHPPPSSFPRGDVMMTTRLSPPLEGTIVAAEIDQVTTRCVTIEKIVICDFFTPHVIFLRRSILKST
jgi:hypothetical protein